MNGAGQDHERRNGFLAQFKAAVKANLAAGVLALAPIGATVLFLRFVVNQVDRVLLLLPEPYRPENYLPFPAPAPGPAGGPAGDAGAPADGAHDQSE